MGVVRVKAGVQFTRITPAGFRILGALEQTVRPLAYDLTITSACDGHPATDPHTRGDAYDVRTQALSVAQKTYVLRAMLLALSNGSALDAPVEVSGGLATGRFFGQIEDPGGPQEHAHFQLRRGRTYPS